MMKPLRKRHLQVWLALAVLIPAGILLGWLAIPNSQPVKLLQTPDIGPLPVIKSTNDKFNYTVNLRTNDQHDQWQLEWKNKVPLTVPSAVVYKTSPKISKGEADDSFQPAQAELIGRIEARGDYLFSVGLDAGSPGELNLVLYDFIHGKKIDTINLRL